MASKVEKELKVIFIGDTDVGKTSIFKLYMHHKVDLKNLPTIGVETRENIVYTKDSDEKVLLYVNDTTGCERFKSVTRQFYRGTDIACLVYDVTNYDSFDHIGEWKRDIETYANNSKVKMILIANKCDKTNDQWRVLSSDGREYAERSNMRFIEMSAHNIGYLGVIDDILIEVVSEVIAEGGGTKSDVSHVTVPPPDKPSHCSRC